MHNEENAGCISPYHNNVNECTRHLCPDCSGANSPDTLPSNKKPNKLNYAWPDSRPLSTTEFAKSGMKVIGTEVPPTCAGPDFFSLYTVRELMKQSDYELEKYGRLTDPMLYDSTSDMYVPITWDDAFALIAEHLQRIETPDQAAFYTSGRTSNEAAFLYQLFARMYGTNNFPDCSNMCHEATSHGLPHTVGIGKGTVTWDDFALADTILIFGQNLATQHPRMMKQLSECAKHGTTIVSVNTLMEGGTQALQSHETSEELLLNSNAMFVRPSLSGDFALIKAVAKRVVELDDEAAAAGRPRILDTDFIASHTIGFHEFARNLRDESWYLLLQESGVDQKQIERLTRIYVNSKRTISCWGTGLTQHTNSVAAIQMLANLMMMLGNIGRPGAGLYPMNGQTNSQGTRTVGIQGQPSEAFLERLEQVFDFVPPRHHGYDVVSTIKAMNEGRIKVFFSMGGNFSVSAPDTTLTWQGLRQCELTVNVATKLNRSHLVHGDKALLLPTLQHNEVDIQNGIAQGVTREDSMSTVHISYGTQQPAFPNLLSEITIVARMAQATLGDTKFDWLARAANYALIREDIEKVFEDFSEYNERVSKSEGLRLPRLSYQRDGIPPRRKAHFVINSIDRDTPIHRAKAIQGKRLLQMMTMRSRNQYNTTIYALDDNHRDLPGSRNVIFINKDDLKMLDLKSGDQVDILSISTDGLERRANGFRLVEYDMPRGCVGTYYPEANSLVPLTSVTTGAGSPTYKSIPVVLLSVEVAPLYK